MAAEDEGRARRPIEPLASVVSESVTLGYGALELVLEGLSESLRIQSGRSPGASHEGQSATASEPAGASARGPARGSASAPPDPAAAAGLVGDFAAIAAELLS